MSAPNDGPWETGHGNPEVVYAGLGSNKYEIATVAGPTSVVPHRKTFENAKLISAAPALLAVARALLRLVRDCGTCEGTGHDAKRRHSTDDACRDCGGVGERLESCGEIGDLRAAIAKAGVS